MFFIWIIIYQIPDGKFHLIACDVGQGDSALAIYKNYQILTDGGPPNGKASECLSKYMPFWDRKIELVINTHPQLDHFGGLINIFKNYKVDNFIENDIEVSTPEYKLLEKVVVSNGTHITHPDTNLNVRVGLMQYDIFYSYAEALAKAEPTKIEDVNDYSIQALLKFGEFTALLTGDIGENMSEEVLKNFPKQTVNYIKIPHHGSRNGMTQSYLREIMPNVAVISVGKNNSYGHPSKKVLKILSDKDIKILRTDEMGSIELISNGSIFWIKN